MLLKATKVCKRCHKEKLLSEYSKSSSRKDGLQHWCKECLSEANRDREYRKSTKKYYAYLKRLRYYKTKHGLSYTLLKNEQEKRYNKIIFKCLHCGKKLESSLYKAADTRFTCSDCFNKGFLSKNNAVDNKDSKDTNAFISTDDWLKYIRELPDESPKQLETVKIIYIPIKEEKQESPKQSRFIKWLKKLFNKH